HDRQSHSFYPHLETQEINPFPTRRSSDLEQEAREVKRVAKTLLATLKQEKLVLDWKKQQTTRATVRLTIDSLLDELPRTYSPELDRKSTRLNSSHVSISYAVFCLKKKKDN